MERFQHNEVVLPGSERTSDQPREREVLEWLPKGESYKDGYC